MNQAMSSRELAAILMSGSDAHISMAVKYCKKCGAHKALAEFHRHKQAKDGLLVYCKACEKARKAEAYMQNKEKVLARFKAQYEKNREAVRDAQRAYWAENKERLAARKKAYHAENLHKVLARNAKRRSAQLLRTPKWLTQQDFDAIEFMYAQAKALKVSTGVPHHVDHIYPLQGRYVSGLHVPANLQLLTASENLSKNNQWTPE